MFKMNVLISRIAVALAFVVLMQNHASADENDPPTRAARLAYAEGSVAFQPGGTDDWVAATINRPLTTGDQLWSDLNSRAELQLDGSLLRLAATTSVTLLNVNDNTTQIQLSQGVLLVRVRRLDDNETYEIDTPNLAFSILRPGLYRISVDASGTRTDIRVNSGQGEVTGGGTAYTVQADEAVAFSGVDQLTEVAPEYPRNADSFEAWSANRDDRWEHSLSSQYVSPDIVGYEDLDDQGAWRPVPEYGNVWFPSHVETGWAPYHNGHWSYIAPWGYTWVDEHPWGFAPFHYGRWVSVRGAWGWIPTPPRPRYGDYVRPVYAPALVAWVGVGAGVAWFALGPRDVYVPSYPVSRRYLNNINVSNTTVNKTVINNVYNTTIINNKTVNVTNVNYINRNVPGSIAATTSQAFNNAQPVSRNFVRLDQRAISSAPIRAVAPATAPTKQSVLGAGAVIAAKPPAAVQTRAIVARAPPPPPQPTFANRTQAIEANAGKPLSMSQVQRMQASEPPRRAPIRIAPAATPIQSNLRSAPPVAPVITPSRADPRSGPTPAATIGSARPPTVPVHPNQLPAAPMPASPSIANSALERQHLQQQLQQHTQQEAERQKAQQQQELAHQQLAKQQAEDARKQQSAREQQQQQAQQLAQQRAQQDAERQKAQQQQTQQLSQQRAQQEAERQRAQQQQAQQSAQQRAQQDAERQKAQQLQEMARQQQAAREQQSRQQADEARKQQVEQQHQQQTQALAEKHALEQQELQKKQQEERRTQEAQTKPINRKDPHPSTPPK